MRQQIAAKNQITFKASKNWVSALKKRLNLVIRKITSVSSYFPENFDEVALEFKKQCNEVINTYEISNSCIANADETNICFYTKADYTLDIKGKKNITVNVAKEFRRIQRMLYSAPTGHVKHVTLMLTITADGRTLQPMLIFKEYKGKMNKTIFNALNKHGMFISESDSGWMTTKLYKRWLNNVIEPFALNNNDTNCLFVDLHASHTSSDSVKEIMKIKDLEVIYIPSGCTSKLQPLDVLVFKTLKQCIKSKWIALTHKHSSEQLGDQYRQYIIDIVYNSIKEVSQNLIKKSFIMDSNYVASSWYY